MAFCVFQQIQEEASLLNDSVRIRQRICLGQRRRDEKGQGQEKGKVWVNVCSLLFLELEAL